MYTGQFPFECNSDWRYLCSVTCLRNNGRTLMRTSHSLLHVLSHKANIMPARLRANGVSVTQSLNYCIHSGDSKGGLGGPRPPQVFAWLPVWPPVFFPNFRFKFLWLTYVGLPNAFCDNTSHFFNRARSKLCRNS